MRIGIIGAGNMGGTLTRRLSALGHAVSVANSRGPESLARLARETGALPTTVTEGGRDAEVLILAIPEKNIPDLPRKLADPVPHSTIVIDTGNYAPKQRDGKIDELENGVTESRWVEAHLAHPVIKAFNNIRPPSLLNRGTPAGTPGRIALPVAGDDPSAKATVIELINQLGFDARTGHGRLRRWRQQSGTPIYVTDLDSHPAQNALAAATPERPAQWRA